MSSITDKLRTDFIDLLGQFLSALSVTFPECGGVRRLKLELMMACTHALTPELKCTAETEIMTQFHEALEPWYAQIEKQDEDFFLNCTSDMLRDVDLPGKWRDPSVSSETRECIWEYVQSLAELLKIWAVYRTMPDGVAEQMQTMAASLITADGGINLAGLDPSSLSSLGESLMEGKSEEEVEAFAKSMLASATSVLSSQAGGASGGAADALSGIMSGAGGGGMAAALGGLLGGGGGGSADGGVDPSALLSAFGGAGGLMNLAMSATKK